MKTKQLLIGIVVLSMAFQPAFIMADVPEAVVYLQAQAQDPWITQALVAADATNIPTDHLSSVFEGMNPANDYAKAILALAAVGENPKTFGNIDYVAKLKTYYNNNQMGDEGLLNDDMWSILALASVGEINSNEANMAKDFLLANQNTDGGWGYAVGAGSDSNDTAAAIIALVEAGASSSDLVITNAIAYLESTQNNDGGFGYYVGSESDTNSTSWIVWAIRKLGQSPDSWSKDSNKPLDFIKSMQNSDGSFGRTSSNAASNVMATQDAVIALSGKVLPLGYFQENGYLLRIEGPDSTICSKFLTGTTAYDLLVFGEIECGYTFSGNRDWGTFFLDSINDIDNNFPSYWMYLVNNNTTDNGLEQYVLQHGDEILIYYDVDTNSPAYPDFDRPLRISVNNTSPEIGENITVMVEYYNQIWLSAEGATVFGGDQNYQTDSKGEVTIPLSLGYYNLYAQKDSFIRSNQEEIFVGASVAQSVGLIVEIEQFGSFDGVGIAGEAIIFEVLPSQLNFGKIKPGNTVSQTLNISNSGTVGLIVAASMNGDAVFKENMKLDNQLWTNYSTALASDESKDVEANLSIPANYLDSGIKTGELILWAKAQ